MLVQLELLLLLQVKGEEGTEGGSPDNTEEKGEGCLLYTSDAADE